MPPALSCEACASRGWASWGSDGFFEWVKERVHLFRGAVIGTLLRNDALSFIGIGTLIERAFATTQLLLIKDQQLTNDPDPVREYYRLDTLLNAVSAREAYNSLYRQPVSRETVMELLILRNDIPAFAARQHCRPGGRAGEDCQRSFLSAVAPRPSAQR